MCVRDAWESQVTAIAYDNPIPGFHTNNTINLRLWAAKPGQEFDLEAFNTGDYVQVRSFPFPAGCVTLCSSPGRLGPCPARSAKQILSFRPSVIVHSIASL